MSTPVPIPDTDRKAVAAVTSALVSAAAADGSDELAVLCNALQHDVHQYIATVRGTRESAVNRPLTPDVEGAVYAINSALRVLTQDIALRDTVDQDVARACDALLWRLRDAHSLLTTGSR